MKRKERVAQVRELEAQGMTSGEIARKLGISYGYAREIRGDPDGVRAKERKESYRGKCIDCGRATDGSNGRAGAPERCRECASDYYWAKNKVWTRESCIAAMQLFYEQHGRTPTAHEHGTGGSREVRQLKRVEWLPSITTLVKVFDSRAAAYEAAGLPAPRGSGDRITVPAYMRSAQGGSLPSS